MEQPKYSQVIRTLAFAYPYVYDSMPLFYRVWIQNIFFPQFGGEGRDQSSVVEQLLGI